LKRSLKRTLYVHIFLVTVGIILTNRFATQVLLLGQMQERGWQDLATSMIECDQHLDRPADFRLCAQALHPSAVSSVLSHGYEVCPPAVPQLGQSDTICQGLASVRPQWSLRGQASDGRIDVLYAKVEDEAWWGVRPSGQSQGTHVWLPDRSITRLRDELWSIRDRNLGYVMPVILAMLGLLTMSVTYLVMRPIRMLESTLASLTSTTLGQSTRLHAPFREFERIVQVYEDLRSRLNDS
jgi:hypothetical protein